MRTNILKYDIVRDVAAGGAEVSSGPEVTAPISFAQFGKLHLDPMRRTPFDSAHEVADRNVGRYLDKHVGMLRRKPAENNHIGRALDRERIIVGMCSRTAQSKTF